MQVIVDISLYPMANDYDGHILTLIQNLQSVNGIEVTPGETSTVVRGEYDVVFEVLEREIKAILSSKVRSALVIKLLNTA